jgi:hypothetical protein
MASSGAAVKRPMTSEERKVIRYPIIFASITFVIGMLFVKETKDVDIYRHD